MTEQPTPNVRPRRDRLRVIWKWIATGEPAIQFQPRRDRFTLLWLIVFGLYFLLVVYGNELDRIFNLWLMLVPLLLFPGAIIAIAWLIMLIVQIAHRHWRRAASQLAAPFIVGALFAAIGAAGITPQRLRFLWNKHSYQEALARLPEDERHFATFDWGSTGGAAVTNFSFTLAFDDTDNLGRPPEQRSAEWVEHLTQACLRQKRCNLYDVFRGKRDQVEITPMGEHFFVVTEWF